MDIEKFNFKIVLNIYQNIGQLGMFNEEELNKTCATKTTNTLTTTSLTTKPDIKKMDIEEVNDNIVFNIKPNNRQENIKNNIANIELCNQSSQTKMVDNVYDNTIGREYWNNHSETSNKKKTSRLGSSTRTSTTTLPRRLRTTHSSITTMATTSKMTTAMSRRNT